MNNENNNINSTPLTNENPNVINHPVTGSEEQPNIVVPSTNNVNVVSNDSNHGVVSSESNGIVHSNNNDNSSDIVVNEKLKQVEVNYQPPSKFKTFMLILLFAFLIAFVIFLPDISKYIRLYKSGELAKKEEVITTGKLVCTLETNTSNLDKSYSRTFNYTDNKLESATYKTTIRGDVTLDEETLDSLAKQCNLIKSNVSQLNGVTVECSYTEGKLIEVESFDYSNYSVEDVKAAYTEAGSSIIEYDVGEDIDIIMKNMRQGGFNCNKEK